MVGSVALVIVALGLAMTAWVQVRPLRRHRMLLDTLAILPEWRFYAQASLGTAEDFARDVHVLMRTRDAGDRVGGWTPVLWPPERRLTDAVWNARGRIDAMILSLAEDMAQQHRGAPGADVQQSIPYLVVLRRVMAEATPGPDVARQFAVAHAIGRGERRWSVEFVSAWHR
ncbi:hypothetical protein ASE86_14640 [Sphingomonas sp. Leaf33]|nr:hypothetical protein ASE86_14640 [Sphingomonas sp. Leaf33]